MLAAAGRAALVPLAVGYGLAVRLRNFAYDRQWKAIHHASVPVVCIGNLTVGGTGKTPMVEFFARRFRQKGIRVAILSRGYGSVDGPNDEALVLEDNLPDVPHLQGKDRVQSADIACEELESQLLLMDDGFQHRRLHRNLDVVLLDATAPFGGGRLLPAGLLREPLSGLKRAHLVILTRCDAVSQTQRNDIFQRVRKIAGQVPWAEIRFEPTLLRQVSQEPRPSSDLQGKKVLAFCGIGNPAAFYADLERLGTQILATRDYPDHHNYSRDDVRVLHHWAAEHQPDFLVTTQKDLVKLQVANLGRIPLIATQITAVVEKGADEIDRAIEQMSAMTA